MKRYLPVILACLTLGLAPYVPEPHLVGKIRWILGGARGMQPLDWWDAIQHGAPWLVLIYFVLADLVEKISNRGTTSNSNS